MNFGVLAIGIFFVEPKEELDRRLSRRVQTVVGPPIFAAEALEIQRGNG